MTDENHPLAGGWLDEVDFEIDPEALFAKLGEDQPLTYHARVDDPRLERLRLEKPRSKQLLQVRNAIITDTMLAHYAGKWVSYSRNNNFYTQQARYRIEACHSVAATSLRQSIYWVAPAS